MKWKPKKYQQYYSIKIFMGKIDTVQLCWGNDDVDNLLHRMGNCFRLKKEANEKSKQIKTILKGN